MEKVETVRIFRIVLESQNSMQGSYFNAEPENILELPLDFVKFPFPNSESPNDYYAFGKPGVRGEHYFLEPKEDKLQVAEIQKALSKTLGKQHLFVCENVNVGYYLKHVSTEKYVSFDHKSMELYLQEKPNNAVLFKKPCNSEEV